MTLLPAVLLGSLALVFVWGLISPRTQWMVLVGWTRSDFRASEPGRAVYNASRFVSLVGVLTILAMVLAWAVGGLTFGGPQSSRPPSVAERVWGEPRAYVVDRVFSAVGEPPAGLVDQRVSGYQFVQADLRSPAYLWETGAIRAAGQAAQPGFIGVQPIPESVALDTADIVVHVRADERCIPQQVMLRGVEGAVQVGVFFGQPIPADGIPTDASDDCAQEPEESAARAYLIPIDLTEPLGDRSVQTLDGTPVALVPAPGD
ncbi:hypothetical protein [Marisediminicola senii]|uniref:hypothetical protein n=1 Tax=Marisediminicola senii TaxID=2711233 RepID=UPI0013EE2EDD|nr:hypothetical protein [Marisediminicola senii]